MEMKEGKYDECDQFLISHTTQGVTRLSRWTGYYITTIPPRRGSWWIEYVREQWHWMMELQRWIEYPIERNIMGMIVLS